MLIGLSVLVIIIPNLVYADSLDGDWFAIEHCPSVSCDENTAENRVVYEEVGGNVRVFGSGSAQVITSGYLAKVFDKSELDGKLVTLEIDLNVLNGKEVQVSIFDGEFDPLPLGACGTDCFPLDAPLVTSGSGGRLNIIATGGSNINDGIKNHTGSGSLSAFDSPTGKVTLMVQQLESCSSCANGSTQYQVTIADLGTYRFKADANDNNWNGTTVACIRECNPNSSTPSSYWTVTSRNPDLIPPVITANISEPIPIMLDKAFDPLQFVSCNDNKDGDITNSMISVGTVDTSDRGSYTVEYTCTDIAVALNSNTQEITYVVQKPSTGITSGTTLDSLQGLGGTTDVQTLDDVPTEQPTESTDIGLPLLSFQDGEMVTSDGVSIADLFANLFGDRITEGITSPAPSVSSPSGVSSGSPAPTQTTNPVVSFFQNLFANFFN